VPAIGIGSTGCSQRVRGETGSAAIAIVATGRQAAHEIAAKARGDEGRVMAEPSLGGTDGTGALV
jgi:hypothetical protein